MLVCQHCHQLLVRAGPRGDLQWICPKCRARVMSRARLHRFLVLETADSLDHRIVRAPAGIGAACPNCRVGMRRVALKVAHDDAAPEVAVDACIRCGLVRFAEESFEQLPRRPRFHEIVADAVVPPGVPDPAARRAEIERERRRWRDDLNDLSWLGRVLMGLGLPVDADAPALTRPPRLTWSLAAGLLVAFLVGRLAGGDATGALEWVAADPFRLGGLTILTSFLVHAGWLHLLGNLYFLLVFGRGVEERAGPGRTALLLAVATVVANLAHAAFDPRPGVPCLGASGGVSALVVVYVASFPWNRFAVGPWILARPFVVPAVVWAAFWIAWQLALALIEHFGGGVSGFAHLGGALTGFVAWLAWRRTARAA